MNLTLVRHGKTIENAEEIIQGHLPGTLSPDGWRQAEAAAEELKDYNFAAIFYSDLGRCRDTAEVIRHIHPLTPFIAPTALRERHCGEAQGKPYDRAYWHSLPGTYETRKYPGGESWADVKQRIMPFLNELFVKHQLEELLLVSHGGPIRAAISILEHRELEAVARQGTPNAGIWHLHMHQLIPVKE